MLNNYFAYRGSPENNDQWIHRLVFPFKKDGFFIEIGAANGKHHSSCWLLEKIGWKGIAIEPNSKFFKNLKKNRNCIKENVCISNLEGFVDFHENENPYLSKIPFKKQKQKLETTQKPCATLKSILKKHNAPKIIEYLSIDIEKGEFNALSKFPFNEYEILAISIEGNECKDLMERNGYINVKNPFNIDCHWENNYIHKSIMNSIHSKVL